MEISKTLYVINRKDWRKWLEKNHAKEPEIWIIYYNKASGKPRIPYDYAVEEALCFGWIDSTVKKINNDSYGQRFSPRNPKSSWSEMNKERVRRLISQGKMTNAGLAVFPDISKEVFKIPTDILKDLKKGNGVWDNFEKFPESYKRIRIGWIDGVRNRPEEFKKRLAYFVKMTKNNKRYGMVQ